MKSLSSYVCTPLLCSLVVCTAILMLGVDIWFRNEAGAHLVWMRNHPAFFSVLQYPGMIQHYRPVAFLMLAVIYHLFGISALPYVLANFAGFLLTLVWFHLLMRDRTGPTAAFFTLLLLFPLFYHVLYYPFNALHGIFYSWDIGWFCLAMYLFIQSVMTPERRIRYALPAIIVSLVALGTHSFSGLTLAVVMVAYLVFHFRSIAKSPWVLVTGVVISLAFLALIPILEPMGEQLFKSGEPIFPQMSKRISLMARIIMIPRIAPILIAGMVQTIVHYSTRERHTSPLWGISAAAVTIILMTLVPLCTAQIVLLALLVLMLVFTMVGVRNNRIFALMALMGMFHYFLVRGESSNYLRFLIFGISPIAVFGMVNVGENLLRRFKLPIPSRKSLPPWAVGLTLLVLGGIALGTLNVPGFRSPVQKIRYLCHLSQTFQQTLFEGTKTIPTDSRVYYYMGRTRAEEIATMYTRVHLYHLQPAKSYEYYHYFDLAGRNDLKFKFVERGVRLSPGETVYIIAFNIYEVLRTRTKFPYAEIAFHVHRGRAEAAIFRLTAPQPATAPSTESS